MWFVCDGDTEGERQRTATTTKYYEVLQNLFQCRSKWNYALHYIRLLVDGELQNKINSISSATGNCLDRHKFQQIVIFLTCLYTSTWAFVMFEKHFYDIYMELSNIPHTLTPLQSNVRVWLEGVCVCVVLHMYVYHSLCPIIFI